MGWTPVWLNELGLHTDLWFLTKKALRNSLAESITTPPASSSPTPPAAAPASPPPRGWPWPSAWTGGLPRHHSPPDFGLALTGATGLWSIRA